VIAGAKGKADRLSPIGLINPGNHESWARSFSQVQGVRLLPPAGVLKYVEGVRSGKNNTVIAEKTRPKLLSQQLHSHRPHRLSFSSPCTTSSLIPAKIVAPAFTWAAVKYYLTAHADNRLAKARFEKIVFGLTKNGSQNHPGRVSPRT
jgi:hypothetical protein